MAVSAPANETAGGVILSARNTTDNDTLLNMPPLPHPQVEVTAAAAALFPNTNTGSTAVLFPRTSTENAIVFLIVFGIDKMSVER